MNFITKNSVSIKYWDIFAHLFNLQDAKASFEYDNDSRRNSLDRIRSNILNIVEL